jgi:AraC-like DNA-binding protein
MNHLFTSRLCFSAIVSISLLVLLQAFPCQVMAKQTNNYEAEIEQVYEYTITDLSKAMAIMRHLRLQKNIPSYTLNEVEGDMYFNRGDYFEALKLYKRSLYDNKLKDNRTIQKKIMRRVLLCYDNIRNISMMSYYANRLLKMAEADNDTMMKAVAYFNFAKLSRYRHNKTLGYQYINKAINLMKISSYRRKYDETYYYYITLMDFLQQDGRNHEGLAMLNKLTYFLSHEKDNSDGRTQELDDSYMKDLNAHYAVFLSRLGFQQQARDHYMKFINSKCEFEYDYTCIMPYMLDNKMYDDIIELSYKRMDYLRKSGDTSGYDMSYIYRTIGDAYMQKHNYMKAAFYYNRLDLLMDSIKNSEEKSAINELTTNYEMKEYELERQRELSSMRLKGVVIIAVLIILAISGFVFREKHYNRVIMKKNRWMAQSIDELQKYKDSMMATDIKINAETTSDDSPTADGESQEDHEDLLMYQKMIHTIIDDKRFLEPNLSRDQLLRELHIPKNKFSTLFKNYGGTTYTKFINDLRLDYAVKLLKLHPNYTINAIAKDCGISSIPTLYQLFSQRYGMTPSEYKTVMLKTEK